jgi:ATP-binding cassette, subfamily F, member 3
MLRVENLSKSYGDHLLFENLSFQLERGERCSLVGRNGSGKSTLMKILIGDECADSGNVSLPRNYRVGYLQQHINFTQPTLLEEASLVLSEEERETPYRVEAILSGLGFDEADFSKPPESFSGGYQLRIQLTKTLAQEPDCLLLDEPTNYLDVVSIKWLEKFLKGWQGEVMLISHDRAFLDAIATHTMGIHRNRLTRVAGTTPAFYDLIIQQEETHERARLKIEKKKNHAEDFIKRFGAKATKAKQAQSRKKAMEKLPSLEKLAQLEDLDFQFRSAPFPGRCMMEISNISFRYPDMEKPLVQNFSLEIEPGERIAIIGKNGRGKSTLLKLMAQDLKPETGIITTSENLAIGYFGQTNVAGLNPNLSIEEEISIANTELPFSEIKRICGLMMFSQNQSEKKIRVLSGGEKSRVLLGKILAAQCNLLLLDEPTNHLDIESIEALMEALESFPGSVVIVTHSEEILYRIPDKLIVCHQHRQDTFHGDYSYFLEKEGWEQDSAAKSKPNKEIRKELKRIRAEQVQARAKALAPVNKQIKKLEEEIEATEKKLSALHHLLQTTPDSIAETSKSIGELQKQNEKTYEKLEACYHEHETITQSYQLDAPPSI